VGAVAVLKRHLHRYQYRRGLVQSILRPVLLLSVLTVLCLHNQSKAFQFSRLLFHCNNRVNHPNH
jgi:cytochrome c oxidase subunit IV